LAKILEIRLKIQDCLKIFRKSSFQEIASPTFTTMSFPSTTVLLNPYTADLDNLNFEIPLSEEIESHDSLPFYRMKIC